ncbi:lipase [Pseudanabaenaceae cyanobacterium LEGE 13415]|nr:lipase [Pseudanabaenaceae cyanobacterium LEGE 13415]
MRLRRRQILLGGVAAGVAATIGTEYQTRHAAEARSAELLARYANDPTRLLQQTFEADAEKIKVGLNIQASIGQSRPTVPYDRAISNLLIQCSKLATQQYLTGKTIPTYDGSIKMLPAYFRELDSYTQLASFRGHEAEVEDTIQVEVPTSAQNNPTDPLEQQTNDAQNAIGQTVKEAVKVRQLTPVYLGFVLTSKAHNIIVFRGTQRNTEWLYNLYARQQEYRNPINESAIGKVHLGFVDNYKSIINPVPVEVAKQLDPNIPCYITGHSLGSALAVLASMEIALMVPTLKPKIQLYTYAGARVGDPDFARVHTQVVPNHFRIVNLADIVPLLPPIQSPSGTFVHTGQVWSFLTQEGDFLPNHVVDTYRQAIVRRVETDQARSYPLSGA